MKFLLIFLFPALLSATSIGIINDSSYTLEIRIFDNDNESVGSAVIAGGGNHYKWMDSYQSASDWTHGPFRIEFFCPNGDRYGVIRNVADGMTVQARAATGPRTCSASSQPEPHRTYSSSPPHSQY